MMGNFKKYEELKDTDTIYLGKVPVHWHPLKINHFTQIVSERNYPDEELLSVYRDFGVIKKDSRDDNHNRAGENLSNYKLVKPNYLVLNKMKTWQGSLGISRYRGIVSPAYITCKLTKSNIYSPFLHYALRSKNYIFEYNRISYGVRTDQWDMRYDEFKNIPVYFPTLEEQKTIANFLDTKTQQIDYFIQLKEKTIALLQERKAALINQAVTCGLDENGQLRERPASLPAPGWKDSGIEWLGAIPEGWEVKKLKYLSRLQSGLAIGPKNLAVGSGGMPYLRVANVQDGFLDLSDVKKVSINSKQVERYLLRQGDLLMNEGGDYDKLGRGYVWENEITPCIHQNHVFAIRMNSTINPYWVNYTTLSFYAKSYFKSKAKRTTNLASISSRNIKEYPVIFPPQNEQDEIIDFMKIEVNRLAENISNMEKEITLIKEYRSSLISAAVTGKIDVREHQKTPQAHVKAEND